MYPATSTFWLDATDEVAVGLRRYARTPDATGWDCAGGYHSMLVYTGVEAAMWRETDHGRVLDTRTRTPRDDPRWPATCAGCGYTFAAGDVWQDWQDLLYRRTDTGQLVTLRGVHNIGDVHGERPPAAGPGAMWDAWWMPQDWRGADGIALMVRLPNGRDWHVDGEASNCTRKGDRSHKCWVRHGDPRQAKVTVDKNGNTCQAGAGSIQAGDWHGFLHHGVLQ